MLCMDQKLLERNKTENIQMVQKSIHFFMASSLIFQLGELQNLINFFQEEEWQMESITQLLYWILWFCLLFISIYHNIRQNTRLLVPQLIILTIRMIMGILDLDKKREDMDNLQIVNYCCFQGCCLCYLQINFNQLINFKGAVIATGIITCFTGVGCFTMVLKYPENSIQCIRIILSDS